MSTIEIIILIKLMIASPVLILAFFYFRRRYRSIRSPEAVFFLTTTFFIALLSSTLCLILMDYKKQIVYSAKKFFLGVLLGCIVFDISSYGLFKIYIDVKNGREYDYNSAFYNNFPKTYSFVKSFDFGLSDRFFVYLESHTFDNYTYDEDIYSDPYTDIDELSEMENNALEEAVYNELISLLPEGEKRSDLSEEGNNRLYNIDEFTLDDFERVIYTFLTAYYNREYDGVLNNLVPGSSIYETVLEERDFWNEGADRTINYADISGVEEIATDRYGAIVVVSENVQLIGDTSEHLIYYYYEIVNIDGSLYIDSEKILAQK